MKHERRIATLPVRKPWVVLALAAVATAWLAVGLPKLLIDATIETMLVSGDPDHASFERKKALFGSDERIIVALKFDDALSPVALRTQRELAESLSTLPGVDDVDALPTVDDIVGTEASLTVARLIPSTADKPVLTDADSSRIRARVDANPILTGALISQDRTVAALHVDLGSSPSPEAAAALIDAVRSLVPGTPHYFAGHPFMKAEIAATMQRDLGIFLPLAVLAMLVLLSAALRSVRMVVAVFSVVLTAVVWMLGAMGWTGLPLTALSNTAPTILIALATAYFMHLAVAHQRLATTSHDPRVVTDRALRAVRRPTLVAGATTGIGFASLGMSRVPMIAGFGEALAIGVTGVVAAACFVLPALLVVLKPQSDGTRPGHSASLGRALFQIGKLTANNSQGLLILAVLLLLVCVAAALRLEVDSSGPRAFDKESLYSQSARFYKAEMSGDVVENIYIDTGSIDAIKAPEFLTALRGYQRSIEDLPQIRKTVSIADYVGKMNRALHSEEPTADVIPGSRAAVAQYLLLYSMSGDLTDFDEFVDPSYSSGRVVAYAEVESSKDSQRLREELQRLATDAFPGHVTNVLSTEILLSRAADSLVAEQARSFAVALILILALVALAFRTGLGAGLLLLPNLMPIALALGGLAALDIPLSQSTAVIGVVALGIAVDGTVHLLSAAIDSKRVYENHDASIIHALDSAGRPIILTGLVVAIGFLVLGLSQFRIVSELGVTISITMLLCVAADLLLLPTQLFLLDRATPNRQAAVLVTIGARTYPAIELESSESVGTFRLIGAESSWRGTDACFASVSWLRSTRERNAKIEPYADVATPVMRLAWLNDTREEVGA